MEKIIRQNNCEQKKISDWNFTPGLRSPAFKNWAQFYSSQFFIAFHESLRIGISCRKLLLHCSTATKNSLKTLAIITAENEADHRVDGAVCGGHEVGKVIV